MNVLPLVSAFLFLFSLCTFAFVQNVRTAIEEHIHIAASYRIHRKFINNTSHAIYKKQRAKNLHSKEDNRENTSSTEFHSPRDAFNKRSETKLNIRPLLEKIDTHQLEQMTLTLLKNLYFFAPFYQEDLEKEILYTLQNTLKEHPDCTRLDKLLSFIPQKQFPLFYKLIKGTQNYKIHTTKGYPALGDFITIEKIQMTTPPIHFCLASRPLLEAVLGPTLTPLLINEEKHKWEKDHTHHPLTKQELEAFLLLHKQNPMHYQNLFSFDTKTKPSLFDIIEDSKTGIQMKIEK